jgi:hypothetical protein
MRLRRCKGSLSGLQPEFFGYQGSAIPICFAGVSIVCINYFADQPVESGLKAPRMRASSGRVVADKTDVTAGVGAGTFTEKLTVRS